MAQKKSDTPVAEAPPEVPAKFDPSRAGILDIIQHLKSMAADADAIAASLVAHERNRGCIDHGAYSGNGYPDLKSQAPDDPAMQARLRMLSTAATEFTNTVRSWS